MTLLFIDGFDHYTSGTQAGMNTVETGSLTYSPGRFGDGRFKRVNGDGVVFPTTLSSYVLGVALKHSESANGWNFVVGDLAVQGDFGDFGNGAINVEGLFGTHTSQQALVYPDTWSYIELKVVTGASGSYAVRLNGVAIPGLPDQTGINIGSAPGVVLFGPASWVSNIDIDDFYLCDLNGSVNNDFLGDVRVETIRPNGNGSSATWSGSTVSGSNTYQNVDDDITNSDTDYNYTNVVGNKDLYAASDLSTVITGTVLGVQVNLHARKSDSGTRGIKSVVKVGASEADGPEHGTIATGYQWFHDMRENKPGGTGWTISDVNGMEIGVKVST